jgi:Flp pilus assembly CpaE family ATPase
MPDAKWEGYHAPIGRSVTSLTVVLRRKCRLLLLRVRAAESGPKRSGRLFAFVSAVGGVPAAPADEGRAS